MHRLLIYGVFALFLRVGNCKTCDQVLKNEERLKCVLLKDYNELAVPTDENKTVEIQVVIHPIQMEVEEMQSTVTLDVWFNLTWIDKKLKWNPDNYGGLENVQIDCSKIWDPSFSGVTRNGYVMQKTTSNNWVRAQLGIGL
ncbi:acetylcholine receptor subunit alpha [Nilaparvata lugens]|uniref:acetylcholine receptor subunit alpha n=1 Tax=Nilaparvata lugens TaxID=108931 RepID=UPI00193C8EDC|nr:acetylcholine receptor subunit alpha [Nilaparvata lugens]